MAIKFAYARKFFTEGAVKDRIFSGYAAAYGNVDHDGDILHPGVFAKSIKEAFPAGKIKVLWQHKDPLGMPVAMHEDSKGLYVEAKISKTALGNEALELINDGVVDSMSVGFRMVNGKSDRDASGIRHIREGALIEFSAVTFPANEQAVITGLKALHEMAYYNQTSELSERNRVEILAELKALTALLDKSYQPPIGTGRRQEAAPIDDALKSMLSEFTALANQTKKRG
jgi:HK97 family phage prohead protease